MLCEQSGAAPNHMHLIGGGNEFQISLHWVPAEDASQPTQPKIYATLTHKHTRTLMDALE